jgi:hypothetical protein
MSFRRLPVVCLAIGAISSAIILWRYAVDVPMGDEWSFVPRLWLASRDGTLSFGELLLQHNEHRILVTKVIYLVVVSLFGWHPVLLMVLTQVLLFAIAVGCMRLSRSTLPPTGVSALTLALSLLVWYTPVQAENLLWGMQFGFYVPPLCLVALLLLVRRPMPAGWLLGLSAALAFTASFTLANGLLLWGLAPIAIAMLAPRRPARPWLFWSAWAIVTTASIWLYFRGFVRVMTMPTSDRLRAIVREPWPMVQGVAIGLGAPLGPRNDIDAALRAGYVFLVVTAVVIGWLGVRAVRRRELLHQSMPWLILGAFGLGFFLMSVPSRVGFFGHAAMFAGRYGVYWACLVVSALHILALLVQDATTARGPSRAGVVFWALCAIALVGGMARNLPSALAWLDVKREHTLQARAQLVFADVMPSAPPILFLAWDELRVSVAELRKRGLLPNDLRRVEWTTTTDPATPCAFGAVISRMPRTDRPHRLDVRGWAYLPGGERPADAAVLTLARDRPVPFTAVTPVFERRQIADRLGIDRTERIGWEIELSDDISSSVTYWAFDAETYRAFPLCH